MAPQEGPIVKTALVVAICLIWVAPHAPSPGLEGDWTACLTKANDSESVCGSITVDTLSQLVRPSGLPVYYYRFTHDIDLVRLVGHDGKYLGRFGTFLSYDSLATFALYLGMDEHALYGWDGGWLLSDLQQSGDSLYGDWNRTCYAGCPEHGRIVFRRISKQ